MAAETIALPGTVEVSSETIIAAAAANPHI
jgi:hypothetical protein